MLRGGGGGLFWHWRRIGCRLVSRRRSTNQITQSKKVRTWECVHSVEKVKTQKGHIIIYLLVNLPHSLNVYVSMPLSHTHCALAPSFPPSLPPSLPVQNRVIQAFRTLPVHTGLETPFCVTSFCLLQVLTPLAPTCFSEETCCAEWGT